MKPMLDPKIDLVGATPETLACALSTFIYKSHFLYHYLVRELYHSLGL